jgi:UDP-N-acetylmuramate dehydrogenase
MSSAGEREFVALFGPERVRREAPLAPLTTMKVGGPADLLIEVSRSGELVSALALAARLGLPATVLGGGSNVLVSDAGVRGVVVRVHGGEIAAAGESGVRADAGVRLNGLIRWTISHGLAGVEAFAGTPGSVGGAVSGNAHFGGRSIGEWVGCVQVWRPGGALAELTAAQMEFAYGRSRVQRSGEVVVSATFDLTPGTSPEALRETARRSLEQRQRTQPLGMPSAGCAFRNPDPAVDRVPEGIPPSAGALIDRAGLKGAAIGGARVSTRHANFIVNDGGATAAEVRRLIDRCRDEVLARFGVRLQEEIRLLGW